MSRLFIYDENMTDERAKITVAKMGGHFRHCGTGKRVYPVQCPGSRYNYGRVRHCGRGKRSI